MAALKAQTYRNFKILVVDNGSTDGSVDWLKERQIDTIFLEENTGFSGAVNVGIRAADTPYVILLNNDTRAEEYFVAELVRAIEQSERIFSVSSWLNPAMMAEQKISRSTAAVSPGAPFITSWAF